VRAWAGAGPPSEGLQPQSFWVLALVVGGEHGAGLAGLVSQGAVAQGAANQWQLLDGHREGFPTGLRGVGSL
jgi:hypothetical protein